MASVVRTVARRSTPHNDSKFDMLVELEDIMSGDNRCPRAHKKVNCEKSESEMISLSLDVHLVGHGRLMCACPDNGSSF